MKTDRKFFFDVLCIAAHRDDAEIMVGGTLTKMSDLGYRVAILDLTEGEMGTRGDACIREQESLRAAAVMGVAHRENLKIPDTRVEVTFDNRLKLIEALRRLRPKVLLAPYCGQKHPDHNHTYELVKEACFFSGLRKLETGSEPFRPKKLLYCLNHSHKIEPHFLVDISAQFGRKMEALRCYRTQFVDIEEHLHLTPYVEGIFERIEYYNGYLGRLIRTKYAEGFISTEPMLVEDITKIPLNTF